MSKQLMIHEKHHGFTLIEMLLVLVIISIIILAGVGYFQQRAQQMRIDRTSLQMQQILNAGMSYYIVNSKWPAKLSDLYGKYLPKTIVNSPWQTPYHITGTESLFYVYTVVTENTLGLAPIEANEIAGTLPLSYTSGGGGNPPDINTQCATNDTKCNVVGAVNVPGQNLNNANAVTFSGLYHHGGCVPVPTCPVDNTNTPMVPQIFVVPVSVSGINDATSKSGGGKPNVYPISSFTAYATPSGTPANTTPPQCTANVTTTYNSGGSGDDCTQGLAGSSPTAASAYWRVCLQVVTERGSTSPGVGSSMDDAWGQYVTLLAFTRCSSPTESNKSGSSFQVFSN